MIVWIASYPKSGNTWIRSLVSSYLFSEDGTFNFKLLKKVDQFTNNNFTTNNAENLDYQSRISKNWIPSQELINKDKKIHLYKTHNAVCTINGNKFTDKSNTLAAIYIVRDPRNLITSLAHHYELSHDEAFNFLSNRRKIIFPIKINEKMGHMKNHEDFNFLSDWSSHYQSWKNINFCPVKIIKYEDCLIDVKKVFVSTLHFLSRFLNFKFDKRKIKKTITSTSFKNLSQMEQNEGFHESVISGKTMKKIRFFNLGKKNNWKTMLSKKLRKKIEDRFNKEMTELDYL